MFQASAGSSSLEMDTPLASAAAMPSDTAASAHARTSGVLYSAP